MIQQIILLDQDQLPDVFTNLLDIFTNLILR